MNTILAIYKKDRAPHFEWKSIYLQSLKTGPARLEILLLLPRRRRRRVIVSLLLLVQL